MIDKRFHGIDLALKDLYRLKSYAKSLRFNSHKNVATDFSGTKTSVFHGRGMDFDEVRIYQAGDDIRSMDWRVTARTGKPHTKLYKQEREQPLYLIANFSASMQFGTQVTFKSTLAAQIAALFAWKTILNHDRIGGFIYNNTEAKFYNPSSSEKSLLLLLKNLVEFSKNPHQESIDPAILENVLRRSNNLIKSGSQVIIISDFLEFDFEKHQFYLYQLAKKQQLLFIHVYDNLEQQAPKPNWYSITDGEELFQFNTAKQSFRDAYQKSFTENQLALQYFCRKFNIKCLSIRTDEDFVKSLQGVS